MKKLFSIVLMGAGLLIGTQVNAAVQVNDEAGLRSAIYNAAAGDSVAIELTDNITVAGGPINIFVGENEKGKTIDIDLKGFNITSGAWNVFNLFKGHLIIKGNGKVENTLASDKIWKNCAICIFGHYNPEAEDWSVLTVKGNVKIEATGAGDGARAIEIYQSMEKAISTAYGTSSMFTTANGIKEVKDSLYSTVAENNKFWVSYKIDATVYGKYNNETKDCVNHAFGVVVDLQDNVEVYGYNYGVQITGTIRDMSGNVPEIYIGKNVKVRGSNWNESAACYGAGYGIWHIEGTVEGNTGIYAKSGEITLDGATVKSTSTEYTAIVTRGSGVTAGGSAVVLECNSSYSDSIQFNIMGESQLTATTGYAVEGVVTSEYEKYLDVEILNGTITGGNAGCLNFDAQVAEEVKENGTITGGTFNGDITEYLGEETGVITQTVDKDGNIVYAVTSKDPEDEWVTNLLTAGENDLVKVEANVVVEDDVTVKYISVKAGSTITVQNNATLTTGELVMGDGTAVIDVKPGSKLVVTGANGIVSNNANSIILGAQEGNSSYFLLNPDVDANRNPMATVKFISKAKTTGTAPNKKYTFQRFGIPTNSALKTFTSDASGFNTWIYDYDADKDQWHELGKLGEFDVTTMNRPFAGYNMECSSATPGQSYTMTCALVGNVDAELESNLTWTTYANSYLADMDLEAFVAEMNPNLTEGVYVYTVNGDGYTWELKSEKMHSLKGAILPAMQAFILHNPTRYIQASTIDYANAVYNPFIGGSKVASRVADEGAYAVISLANQNGQTDMLALNLAEADGKDMPKYKNEDVNFFVSAEEAMATWTAAELDRTYIGFSCAKSGEYTVNVDANNAVEGYVLVDLVNNAQIALVEGNSYRFSATAGESNDYRFQVRKIAEQATALDNVEAAAKADGIYTITGQFVGNKSMLNNLPAGVYVVDGKKVVK